MIRLIIFPTVPGRFRAVVSATTARLETAPQDRPETGLVIVISSPQPLVDGARRLLELGYDPGVALAMRHAGKDYDSFEPAPIGQWAKITYEETRSGPIARPYRPFDAAAGERLRKRNPGSDGT